jgi:hypothetical protein
MFGITNGDFWLVATKITAQEDLQCGSKTRFYGQDKAFFQQKKSHWRSIHHTLMNIYNLQKLVEVGTTTWIHDRSFADLGRSLWGT